MAFAEPAGYSLVSNLGGCVWPRFPGLKGTLLALTSWADRGFVRLPMKNHSRQVLSWWACLVKGGRR